MMTTISDYFRIISSTSCFPLPYGTGITVVIVVVDSCRHVLMTIYLWWNFLSKMVPKSMCQTMKGGHRYMPQLVVGTLILQGKVTPVTSMLVLYMIVFLNICGWWLIPV